MATTRVSAMKPSFQSFNIAKFSITDARLTTPEKKDINKKSSNKLFGKYVRIIFIVKLYACLLNIRFQHDKNYCVGCSLLLHDEFFIWYFFPY